MNSQRRKTRLYNTGQIPGAGTVFLVGYHERSLDLGQTLFTDRLPQDFEFTAHEFVDRIEDADFAIFPHAIKSRRDRLISHVTEAKERAARAGKKLIVFIGGDLSHNIFIDGVIVLKGSQYRHLMRKNEIIVPPWIEDLGAEYGCTFRPKSARPVVSFCGWAGFSDPISYFKYVVKNALIDLASITHPVVQVHKKGIYWRRRALKALAKGSDIDTRFIIRKSFSGNTKTIGMDAGTARKEYIQNITESDFVLAPKGDANFSLRFYEALSLGRIPILIDTDTPLPLEDELEYDQFVIRVPFAQLDHIGQIIRSTYQALSDDEYRRLQGTARTTFREFLRYDTFFNRLFSSDRLLRAAATFS